MRALLFLIGFLWYADCQAQPNRWAGPIHGPSSVQIMTAERAYVRLNLHTTDSLVRLRALADSTNWWTVEFDVSAYVRPGDSAEYVVYLDSVPLAGNPYVFHRLPDSTALPELRLAAGSCKLVFGNVAKDPRRKRGKLKILKHIAGFRPDVMLWLGDFLYLRGEEVRDSAAIYRRWRYHFGLPAHQALFQRAVHLAIWDDHEFGPNDADSTFDNKTVTRAAFEHFWVQQEEAPKGADGIYQRRRIGDLELYLLDNRWNRSPLSEPPEQRQLLGQQQLDWLTRRLRTSTATFKLIAIGNQVLNSDTSKSESFNANYQNLYRSEYQRLIDSITTHRIKNVVFLSGDRHMAEFAKLEREGLPAIWDLTSSPLNSPPAGWWLREDYPERIEGSRFNWKNFMLIDLSGPRERRALHVRIFNKRGNLKRELRIQAD